MFLKMATNILQEKLPYLTFISLMQMISISMMAIRMSEKWIKSFLSKASIK